MNSKSILFNSGIPFRRIFFRCLHKNHYEILKLERNCTTKEIKEAFINLSKECHPDKNQSSDSHAKFVRIAEAYNILSKPSSRADYDLGLIRNMSAYTEPSNIYYNVNPIRRASEDPALFRNRNRTKDFYYSNQPYYGIRGIERVHNSRIVFLCILLVIFGTIIQGFAIRGSYNKTIKSLDQKSMENAAFLSAAKGNADLNGNEKQMEIMLGKHNSQNATSREIIN